MSTRTAIGLLALAVTFAAPSLAHADDDPTDLEPSYVYDGGVIPFLYVAAAVGITVQLTVSPRSNPLFFSKSEGGQTDHKSRELPGWQVSAAAVAAGGAIALIPDDARWFHLKGFAESLATTTALTVIAKVTFGRHRPDFRLPDDDRDDEHRSFPSGHSSSTLATATYFALYARQHLFNRWRKPGTVAWWEALTYAGIAGAAVYVPYTRVHDNRHNTSDVIAGGLLGAAASTAMFFWQEHRYKRAVAGSAESRRRTNASIGYSGSGPVFSLGTTF